MGDVKRSHWLAAVAAAMPLLSGAAHAQKAPAADYPVKPS
jgi:hypothetical protein